MRLLRRAAAFALDVLLPRRCPFCGGVIGFSGPCARCEAALPGLRRPAGQPVPPQGRALACLARVDAPYFYEGAVRSAILRMKFSEQPELAHELARQQAEALRQAPCRFDALVPVPSAKRERRRRSYDVPRLLANALRLQTGLPVLYALEKPRETVQQALLSGEARRRNLRGAFTVRPGVCVKGLRLLIVDDVVTTGSTLNECARALQNAGADCCCAVCVAAVR